MRNPIDSLLDEHQRIRASLQGLRQAVGDLEARGEEALPVVLPSLEVVGKMMETLLERHAQKEDEALFPAIEKALGSLSGPTSVLRQRRGRTHPHGAALAASGGSRERSGAHGNLG